MSSGSGRAKGRGFSERNPIILQRGRRAPKRVTSHQAIVRLLLRMDRTKKAYVELRKIGLVTKSELKWAVAVW